jgi:hypothetical protein
VIRATVEGNRGARRPRILDIVMYSIEPDTLDPGPDFFETPSREQ